MDMGVSTYEDASVRSASTVTSDISNSLKSVVLLDCCPQELVRTSKTIRLKNLLIIMDSFWFGLQKKQKRMNYSNKGGCFLCRFYLDIFFKAEIGPDPYIFPQQFQPDLFTMISVQSIVEFIQAKLGSGGPINDKDLVPWSDTGQFCP